MSDPKVRRCVEGFLSDLERLIQKAALTRVESALGGKAPRGSRTTSLGVRPATQGRKSHSVERVRGAAGRKGAAPPASRAAVGAPRPGWLETIVLRYVKTNPGHDIAVIGKALGFSREELSPTLESLVSKGQVHARNDKEVTTYVP